MHIRDQVAEWYRVSGTLPYSHPYLAFVPLGESGEVCRLRDKDVSKYVQQPKTKGEDAEEEVHQQHLNERRLREAAEALELDAEELDELRQRVSAFLGGSSMCFLDDRTALRRCALDPALVEEAEVTQPGRRTKGRRRRSNTTTDKRQTKQQSKNKNKSKRSASSGSSKPPSKRLREAHAEESDQVADEGDGGLYEENYDDDRVYEAYESHSGSASEESEDDNDAEYREDDDDDDGDDGDDDESSVDVSVALESSGMDDQSDEEDQDEVPSRSAGRRKKRTENRKAPASKQTKPTAASGNRGRGGGRRRSGRQTTEKRKKQRIRVQLYSDEESDEENGSSHAEEVDESHVQDEHDEEEDDEGEVEWDQHTEGGGRRSTRSRAKKKKSSKNTSRRREEAFYQQTGGELGSSSRTRGWRLATERSAFSRARSALQLSVVPDRLPMREAQHDAVYSFLRKCLQSGSGACMFLAGMPGTGKTATIRSVTRRLAQEAKSGSLKTERGTKVSFDFLEVNGMDLDTPANVYREIWIKLQPTSQRKKKSSEKALTSLERLFKTKGRRKVTILLLDEVDALLNRKQDVLYNLFDWPSYSTSKLVVLAIANTLDLPESLQSKVRSRLGNERVTFAPYKRKELEEIVLSRLRSIGNESVFDPSTIQVIAAKVASITGDARRALQTCQRATELAEQEAFEEHDKKKEDPRSAAPHQPTGVTLDHVRRACEEMCEDVHVQVMKSLPFYQRLFLISLFLETMYSGSEDASLLDIEARCSALFQMHSDQLQPTALARVQSHQQEREAEDAGAGADTNAEGSFDAEQALRTHDEVQGTVASVVCSPATAVAVAASAAVPPRRREMPSTSCMMLMANELVAANILSAVGAVIDVDMRLRFRVDRYDVQFALEDDPVGVVVGVGNI